MKKKNNLGLFLKSGFAVIGTVLLVASVIAMVNNPDSDYHIILSVAIIIVGAALIGSSMPFKNKKEDEANTDYDLTEEDNLKETKKKKTINLLARIYCLFIGIPALVGALIVYLKKGSSNQEYVALALTLLVVGFMFTTMGLLSKDRY